VTALNWEKARRKDMVRGGGGSAVNAIGVGKGKKPKSVPVATARQLVYLASLGETPGPTCEDHGRHE
jgi:hypothetical protein